MSSELTEWYQGTRWGLAVFISQVDKVGGNNLSYFVIQTVDKTIILKEKHFNDNPLKLTDIK